MSVQTELRELETQKSFAETHLADARALCHDSQERIRHWEGKKQEADRRIRDLRQRQEGLIVSDHAVLRYMERVMGIDMTVLRKEICGGVDPKSIDPSGGLMLLPIGTSHKLRIVDGVAVTTITNEKQER